MVPGEPGETLAASVEAREMSLLGVCANCRGKCCVGRTLVLASEAAGIVGRTGRDEFVRWNDDFLYLDRDRCPYLTSEGLCSVQEIKPFVCKIFPFVPRVVDGEPWLFAVGECSASRVLTPAFIQNSQIIAQRFFDKYGVAAYESYWDSNKVGDFDDSQVVLRVPVWTSSSGANLQEVL